MDVSCPHKGVKRPTESIARPALLPSSLPLTLNPHASAGRQARPTGDASEMDESTADAASAVPSLACSGASATRIPADLQVGLGRDMRLQAPAMATALRDGLIAEGAHVIDAGMVGTEMLYHLVGSRDLDGGAMVTASHNPKAYTGVKLVREGALALSGDAGIGDVQREIEAGLGDARRRTRLQRGGRHLGRVSLLRRRADRARLRAPDEGRRRRRQRDGRPDGGADPPRPRPRPRGDVLRARRRVPRPRAQPAARGKPAA